MPTALELTREEWQPCPFLVSPIISHSILAD